MLNMHNWNLDSIFDHLLIFVATISLGLICAATTPLWAGIVVTGPIWFLFCYPYIKRILGYKI